MKKLFLLFGIAFILSSCGNSGTEKSTGINDEEMLNELIAEATKSTLFIPESYDPVSTQCDTLGTSIVTPANIKKSAKIISLTKEAENLQYRIALDAEMRDYWHDTKEVKRYEEKRDELKAKAKALFAELIDEYWNNRGFYGFYVSHRFRAKNNMGTVMFGEVVYIINKDKTKIVASYNQSDNDFFRFYQMLTAIYEIGKNYNIDEINLEEICDNIKSIPGFIPVPEYTEI